MKKQKETKPKAETVPVKEEPKKIEKFIALESFAFTCDGVLKEIKFQSEFGEEVPESVRKTIKHKVKGL